MKIGIVGYGVVGSALGEWLKYHGGHGLAVLDPPRGMVDEFNDVEAIFLAVPVPTLPDRSQDTGLLSHYVSHFAAFKPGIPIFIKSTVTPGTCDRLAREFKAPVYAMPEFLTERVAQKDFEKNPMVCGGVLDLNPDFIKSIFGAKHVILVTNVEAEIAKYTHNSFAAVKVGYFNVVFELCRRFSANYDAVREAAMITGFIEPTHTAVPGPDGRLGYGGRCLPKDLSAFVGLLYETGVIGAGTLASVESDNSYYREKEVT